MVPRRIVFLTLDIKGSLTGVVDATIERANFHQSLEVLEEE